MHVKFFQPLADIRQHYDFVIGHFGSKFGHTVLETWDIKPDEKELMEEEREALRYLLGLKFLMVQGTKAKKPSIEVATRLFERHLAYLENTLDCNASNVNRYPNKIVQKEYKACKHYLFQFSLPAWYEKLPNEILTFENKYSEKNL